MMTAYEYGKAAFENDMVCVPAYDEKFLEKFIYHNDNHKQKIQFMKEWHKGWTSANIKRGEK